MKKQYEKVKTDTNRGYFDGHLEQAMDCDREGKPLQLSKGDLIDAEDELIRIMHQYFLNGFDSDYFDYNSVDKNPKYDNIQ